MLGVTAYNNFTANDYPIFHSCLHIHTYSQTCKHTLTLCSHTHTLCIHACTLTHTPHSQHAYAHILPPQPEGKPLVTDDPYYVESRDPEEDSTKLPPPKVVPTSEPLPSSGVEDIDVQAETEPCMSTTLYHAHKHTNML